MKKFLFTFCAILLSVITFLIPVSAVEEKPDEQTLLGQFPNHSGTEDYVSPSEADSILHWIPIYKTSDITDPDITLQEMQENAEFYCAVLAKNGKPIGHASFRLKNSVWTYSTYQPYCEEDDGSLGEDLTQYVANGLNPVLILADEAMRYVVFENESVFPDGGDTYLPESVNTYLSARSRNTLNLTEMINCSLDKNERLKNSPYDPEIYGGNIGLFDNIEAAQNKDFSKSAKITTTSSNVVYGIIAAVSIIGIAGYRIVRKRKQTK